MNGETVSEREKIERKILKLYRDMNVQASFGNPEDVNLLRGEIAELERQKQNLKRKE
jgi:hypothetical protein